MGTLLPIVPSLLVSALCDILSSYLYMVCCRCVVMIIMEKTFMQRKHSSSSNACIRNVVFNTGMEEVARILQSISSAASGIRVTFQEERNFRIECVVAFLVILGALVVRVSLLEMAVLALAIGLVLALELV